MEVITVKRTVFREIWMNWGDKHALLKVGN